MLSGSHPARPRRAGPRWELAGSMVACRRSAVGDAVAALTAAALRDLAGRDGAPKLGAMSDLRNWWRYGQEAFVALRPVAWHMPKRVTMLNWLDTFAEMTAVREAIDSDPVWRTRVDTLVGTGFSMQQRRLDWLLVEYLLEPMIISNR